MLRAGPSTRNANPIREKSYGRPRPKPRRRFRWQWLRGIPPCHARPAQQQLRLPSLRPSLYPASTAGCDVFERRQGLAPMLQRLRDLTAQFRPRPSPEHAIFRLETCIEWPNFCTGVTERRFAGLQAQKRSGDRSSPEIGPGRRNRGNEGYQAQARNDPPTTGSPAKRWELVHCRATYSRTQKRSTTARKNARDSAPLRMAVPSLAPHCRPSPHRLNWTTATTNDAVRTATAFS